MPEYTPALNAFDRGAPATGAASIGRPPDTSSLGLEQDDVAVELAARTRSISSSLLLVGVEGVGVRVAAVQRASPDDAGQHEGSLVLRGLGHGPQRTT